MIYKILFSPCAQLHATNPSAHSMCDYACTVRIQQYYFTHRSWSDVT